MGRVALLGGAVIAASLLFSVAATRSRNARLTEIRYISPSPWSGSAQTVAHPSTSHATTSSPFATVVLWRKG